MARSQHRSQKKVSGGRYRQFRTKRKYELAGFPTNTQVRPEALVRTSRTLGGNRKKRILSGNLINVTDPKGKSTKTEILKVIENAANPNLVRRNIITEGAIVETKLGKVRVTSRPGQEGSINGILVGK
ncbi:30S ribosomal protein S8e [Candidatus Woesearchaeota archaeon]|nr:30S ribosomal protein S8e [Candidatus Woesearchaeota archaeon]